MKDQGVDVAEMRDPHRVLVDADDQLGNVEQIAAMARGRLFGLSFEPFAPEVHALDDPAAALRDSIAFVEHRLARQAA